MHQFARGVYGDNGVLKVEIFGNLTGQLKIGGLGPTLAVGRMGAVRGGGRRQRPKTSEPVCISLQLQFNSFLLSVSTLTSRALEILERTFRVDSGLDTAAWVHPLGSLTAASSQ